MNRLIFPAIAVALAAMMPAAVIAQDNSNQQTDQRDQNNRGDRKSERSTKGNDARASAEKSTGNQGASGKDSAPQGTGATANRYPQNLSGSSRGQGSTFGGGNTMSQDRKSAKPSAAGNMQNKGPTGAGPGSVLGTGRTGTANRAPSTVQRQIAQPQAVRPQNWNRYPRNFDRNVYQRNYSASRHFHWRSYSRPHGWYSHRWIFGELFPSFFWTDQYRIYDYWMFDLPIPPYGYVWVRYGDDAILVNVRTGRILQVVYDLFD